MIKKALAVTLELIPILAAAVYFVLFSLPVDSEVIRRILLVAVLLALPGFLIFFVGRKLAKGDRTVLILGILDWLATISIVGFYVIAFMSAGM